MLTDQTFAPLPLMGVGPEVFFSFAHCSKVDISIVNRLRKEFFIVPSFRLVYLALRDSPKFGEQFEFVRTLKTLGIQFQAVDLYVPGKFGAVRYTKEFFKACDFVCSPELELSIMVSHQNTTSDPCSFLDALIHFSKVPEPYSLEAFRRKLNTYG